MKKLLSILAAVGLTATAGATVVACGPQAAATDFTIEFEKDAKFYNGVTGTLKIKDYDTIKKDFGTDWEMVLPEKQEIIKKDVTFDNGVFTFEGAKKGEIEVSVQVSEKKAEGKSTKEGEDDKDKVVKKISNKLKLSVGVAGLDIVKDLTFSKEVANPEAVTEDEANAMISDINDDLPGMIANTIHGIAKEDLDYKTDGIKAGDMSGGVTIEVKAFDKHPDLITKDSKTSVKVEFKKVDTRPDLKDVTIEGVNAKVKDASKINADEVTKITEDIETNVKAGVNAKFKELEYGVDYEVKDLANIVKEGADFTGNEFTTLEVINKSDKVKESMSPFTLHVTQEPTEGKDVTEIVKNLDLGAFDKTAEELTAADVVAKTEELNTDATGLIKVEGDLKIEGVNGTAKIVGINAESNKGSVDVKFTVKDDETPEPGKDVTEIVKNLDLGAFDKTAEELTAADVVAKTEELNTDAKGLIKVEGDLKIEGVNGTAKIVGINAESNKGSVDVKFTVKADETPEPGKDVTEIVKNLDLGAFDKTAEELTAADVVAKTEELNTDAKGLIKVEGDLKIEGVNGTAKIVGINAESNKGSVDVKFTVKEESNEQVELDSSVRQAIIDAKSLKVGMAKDQTLEAVIKAIKDVKGVTVTAADLEFKKTNGNDDAVFPLEQGQIMVKASDSSTILTGRFTVSVNMN